ncbi:DNA repair protein RecN [Segatella albensis]|jgi:DNA repair protein RecN (Recombination protein N)|uniref:DNA repair protein RecN n=1 Tax=Segatella albensis TaxID=77768 RepID=UPI00041073E1|nr:DNA repair protein RecN [Segatella albensis]
MIKRLIIENFTLIEKLDIEFHSGFSVITGETGAGKSIILGAIGLLLGNRADIKAIKQGKSKCVIEAHFDLTRYGMENFFEDNDIDLDLVDTIVRRELTSAGKSRAFINDTPVPLSVMRQLGETLVDIHSQHQNLLLRKEDFQLNVVDIIASDQKIVDEYNKLFLAYKKQKIASEELYEKIKKDRENQEFIRFQYNELDSVNLVAGEQEELEKETETLNHAEDIKSALYRTDNLLNGEDTGVVASLRQVVQSLRSIENVFPKVQDFAQRIDSNYIDIKDIADEISGDTENFEFDPIKQQINNERLDIIYSLEQKYHVETVEELIEIRDNLKVELDHIENSDDAISEMDEKIRKLETEAREKAKQLTEIRKKAALKIEKEMKKRLIPLGIPHVRFEVEITEKPLSSDGIDKINFLFSANTSTPMQPVSQVASGGEIARVMLSLKAMISGTVKLPTIIFDEIDTGVSGKIAEMMAQIMQEMGNNDRQVISITHLPQIAALGATHYKVSKEETSEGTISHMKMLTNEERIKEIAQMLSGSNITEAAISNAKALLKV